VPMSLSYTTPPTPTSSHDAWSTGWCGQVGECPRAGRGDDPSVQLRRHARARRCDARLGLPSHRARRTATKKSRIAILGFGFCTARQKRVLERWTIPKPLQPIRGRATI
jgi:hypothetical protein